MGGLFVVGQSRVVFIPIVLSLLSFLFFPGCAPEAVDVDEVVRMGTDTMNVTSPAFDENGMIPAKYTCDAENVNPELDIDGIPSGAKSLAIIMDDPDAPRGTFDHWVVWNIEPIRKVPEDSLPGVQGVNGAGTYGYIGPCPPSGTHRYFFKVYALDTDLDLPVSSNKRDVEEAMSGHILAEGQLVGVYEKKSAKVEI